MLVGIGASKAPVNGLNESSEVPRAACELGILAKIRLAAAFQAISLVTCRISVTLSAAGVRPTEILRARMLFVRFGSGLSLVTLARSSANPALVPIKPSFTVACAPLVILLSQHARRLVDCFQAPPLRVTEVKVALWGSVWASTTFEAMFWLRLETVSVQMKALLTSAGSPVATALTARSADGPDGMSDVRAMAICAEFARNAKPLVPQRTSLPVAFETPGMIVEPMGSSVATSNAVMRPGLDWNCQNRPAALLPATGPPP